jgi:uncharacterized protein (TIGR02599 family)
MNRTEGKSSPLVAGTKKFSARIPGAEPCPVSLPTQQKFPNIGFTILEMLVAMGVTSLIVVLLLALMQSTTATWQRNTDRSKAFASARAAFESMSRTIGASTLNTYEDYYDANRSNRASGSLTFVPAVYGRCSDLHFVTGNALVNGQQGGGVFFTAPFDFDTNATPPATGGQLNGVGYFVQFSTDPTLPAFITNNPPRYRLFQFLQPTTSLKVMNTNFPGNAWFTNDVNASSNCYPLAANIVAFAVLPKLSERENTNLNSLSTDFSYDSRMAWSGVTQPTNMHQLPPVVRVVMVTLDETSAARIQNGANAPDLGYDPSTIFDTAANLETRLGTIEAKLSGKNLKYRVFRADIPIRAAKWSPN